MRASYVIYEARRKGGGEWYGRFPGVPFDWNLLPWIENAESTADPTLSVSWTRLVEETWGKFTKGGDDVQ
jgi:hypothetical protein